MAQTKKDRYPYYDRERPGRSEIFGPRFETTPSMRGFELQNGNIYYRKYAVEVAVIDEKKRTLSGHTYRQFELRIGGNGFYKSKPDIRSVDADAFFRRMKDALLSSCSDTKIAADVMRRGASSIRSMVDYTLRSVARANVLLTDGLRIARAYLANERDPELLDRIQKWFDMEKEAISMAGIDFDASDILLECQPVTGDIQWYKGEIDNYKNISAAVPILPPESDHHLSMIGMLRLQLSNTDSKYTNASDKTAVAYNGGIHIEGRFRTYVIPHSFHS